MQPRYFLISLFLLFFPGGVLADIQTQGFREYSSQSGKTGTHFLCEDSCFISLGKPTADTFILEVDGEGQGIIAYGVLTAGNQIIPLSTENIIGFSKKKLQGDLWVHPNYSEIRELPMVVIFQGKISGTIYRIGFENSNFFSRMQKRFASYMRLDPFGPATINLLSGPRFGYSSINSIFYGVFLIGMIIIFFFLRKGKRRYALLILGVSLWVVYDLRMSAEFIRNYNKDVSAIINNTDFRDRGDFYTFVDFADRVLSERRIPDFTSISFYSDNTWPFPGSMKYFLYPYRVSHNISSDTAIIVYRSSRVVIESGSLLVDGNSFGTGTIESFSPDAFIFFPKK